MREEKTDVPQPRRQRRPRRLQARPPQFTAAEILRWADAWHERIGRWPHSDSGPIPETLYENWSKVNQALRHGTRGLPGKSSLARLLAERRGVRNRMALPPLTEAQILAWAGQHHRHTGAWPHRNNGRIEGTSETWMTVDCALKAGSRGLPGHSSLARLLAHHRGVRHPKELPALTEAQILTWADAHRARTGRWPHVDSGSIAEELAETWHGIDKALRNGLRGLSGGGSLARLLAERRGARNHLALPRLTEAQVLAWADRHHRRTGAWPHRDSGPIEGTLETWQGVDAALRGHRGLPGGSSLAQLLAAHRGVRNIQALPPLTERQLLAWADAFHARTGCWPDQRSGDIPEAHGEKWSAVNQALVHGARGWPGGYSLARLLADRRGVRNRYHPPPLEVTKILVWADAHHRRTGRWPSQRSGAILEAPGETWTAVDDALRIGHRGLPGGSSLALLLEKERGKLHALHRRHLTERLILRWAQAHWKRTGQWPHAQSGPVVDAPEEKWMNLNQALRLGLRGLPAGSSLQALLARSQAERGKLGRKR